MKKMLRTQKDIKIAKGNMEVYVWIIKKYHGLIRREHLLKQN